MCGLNHHYRTVRWIFCALRELKPDGYLFNLFMRKLLSARSGFFAKLLTKHDHFIEINPARTGLTEDQSGAIFNERF